mmetsp:Transcript_14249/g.21734  ORF Transcript_14249/g.21734 Transcript_14249/m.21734 type:complete len:101 (-) Transcript_14249:334-636(-)
MSSSPTPHMLALNSGIKKPDHTRTWSDCSIQSATSNISDTSRQSLCSTDSNLAPTETESRKSTIPILMDSQDATTTSSTAAPKGKGSRKTHRRSNFCFVG